MQPAHFACYSSAHGHQHQSNLLYGILHKITQPEQISEEFREELLDYLKLEHVQQVENLEEQEVVEGDMQPATT